MNSCRGVLQHYYERFCNKCSMACINVILLKVLLVICYQTTSNEFISDVDVIHFQNDCYKIGGVFGQ